MHIYELQCEQQFPLELEETFAFFQNPANLSKITPPWLNFEIKTQHIEMAEGAEIDYVIRWMGLPMGWKTLIAEYGPPHHFVDLQLRGPYSLWHHSHRFEANASGTLVRDQVRYALPLGPLGRIAHALIVERHLKEIFAFRQTALAGLLGGQKQEQPEPCVRAA